jgi:hypothetical protein
LWQSEEGCSPVRRALPLTGVDRCCNRLMPAHVALIAFRVQRRAVGSDNGACHRSGNIADLRVNGCECIAYALYAGLKMSSVELSVDLLS